MYSLHSLQLETGSRKGRSLQRGRSPAFFVFLFIRMWLLRATNWEAVLVTAYGTVESYRTPDEAMVC